MKARVGAFNQEDALGGAFSKPLDGPSFQALVARAVPAPVVVFLVVHLPALRAVARAPRPLQRRQVRKIKAAAGLQTSHLEYGKSSHAFRGIREFFSLCPLMC